MPLAREAGKAQKAPEGSVPSDIRKPGDLPAQRELQPGGACRCRVCVSTRGAILPHPLPRDIRDTMTEPDPTAGMTAETETELLVCVKCRRGPDEPAGDDRRPGRRLYDRLLSAGAPEGVRLRAVECLQNCDNGCTVALRGGNRWTYVYGNLHEASQVETLIDGAARYHATADGLIPWRERPGHFKRNCVARIPPPDYTDPLSET